MEHITPHISSGISSSYGVTQWLHLLLSFGSAFLLLTSFSIFFISIENGLNASMIWSSPNQEDFKTACWYNPDNGGEQRDETLRGLKFWPQSSIVIRVPGFKFGARRNDIQTFFWTSALWSSPVCTLYFSSISSYDFVI